MWNLPIGERSAVATRSHTDGLDLAGFSGTSAGPQKLLSQVMTRPSHMPQRPVSVSSTSGGGGGGCTLAGGAVLSVFDSYYTSSGGLYFFATVSSNVDLSGLTLIANTQGGISMPFVGIASGRYEFVIMGDYTSIPDPTTVNFTVCGTSAGSFSVYDDG